MNLLKFLLKWFTKNPANKAKTKAKAKAKKKTTKKPLTPKEEAAHFMKQMRKVKPLVTDVLKNNYQARDNDALLLIDVWHKQINKINSYSHFKALLIKGKLSVPETITRTRRALQEKHEDLRGDMYDVRKHQEKEVRNQLKFEFED